ncbi:hypothetical protein [Streptomyces endophytica]|uniref:hypothetical protein n=1 Tax=Streptomyces endophytica TaxID=2991496 RepID=UPI00311B2991
MIAVVPPLGCAATVSRPGPDAVRSASPGRSGVPSAPITATDTSGVRPSPLVAGDGVVRAFPAFSYPPSSRAPASVSFAVTDGVPSATVSPVAGAPR